MYTLFSIDLSKEKQKNSYISRLCYNFLIKPVNVKTKTNPASIHIQVTKSKL